MARLTDFLLIDSFPHMNCPKPSIHPIWPARLRSVFEIVMVSGVVSSLLTSRVFAVVFTVLFGRNHPKLMEMDISFFAAYVLFESTIVFIILFMLMKARGETLSMLGMRRKQWKTNILLGVLAVPCLLLLSSAVSLFFKHFLPEYALDKNPLTEMVHSPRQLILFMIVVIIGGGIKEELQRAFILRRFSQHLGGAVTGIVTWSLIFGAEHYVQGLQGMCSAAILGFIFGILYLIRGNLILTITAHAVYNTLILLIYWFTIGINK